MKRIIYSLLTDIISRNLAKVETNTDPLEKFPYKVEVIAENLNIPWAMDISDEGKLYFTERTGSIKVIENDKLNPNSLITLKAPFISSGESGLMGIALDPDYSQNHYIYVMYSYLEDNKLYNKVVRLVENNNKASIDKVILDKIPGWRIHNGGRLKIGPDKKLYIATGDAATPNLAQDSTSLSGKILRLELDGSIPKDNPIINSPIYSLGHRNPQGLAWNSNNILYEAEHGQTAHDEINLIKAGANYGWPIVQGDEVSDNILSQKPILQSEEETWAPSGITFINQGPWKNRLLVANLRGSQLLNISLNEEGTMVTNVEAIMKNEFGRLRDVIEAKDGSIYITTNNRDGKGNSSINDDRIIKLTPK